MTFDELQKILEEKFQIVRLADIARELSVTPQVVSNWKARNQIPYKYVKTLRKKIEENEELKTKSRIKEQAIFMGYPSSNEQNDDEISGTELILGFFDKLIENLRVIFFCLLFFFALSIWYNFLYAQPVYSSSAKIIPVSDSDANSPMRGIASNFGINVPASSGALLSPSIYPDIIKSRKLLLNTLNRKFETIKYDTILPLINIISNVRDLNYRWSETDKISSINKLRDMISISTTRKNPIITIYANAFEPKLAASIVSVIIEELNQLLNVYSEDRIKDKIKFIEIRIKQVGVELKKNEETLKKFREQNRNINASPGLLIEQGRIIRDVDVQTEIFTTLKTELELAKIEQVEEKSIVLVLDNPELPLYKISPQPVKNLILSLIISICFSVFYIYAKDWYKKNLKDILLDN